jgi:hypothetical protein
LPNGDLLLPLLLFRVTQRSWFSRHLREREHRQPTHIPKMGKPKNKVQKSGTKLAPKNTSRNTTTSPSNHHNFTTKKPSRFTTILRNPLKKPQHKTEFPPCSPRRKKIAVLAKNLA